MMKAALFGTKEDESRACSHPPSGVSKLDLSPDRVLFGVGVREVGREQVGDPAEEPGRAYPREAGQYEPYKAPEDLPVVNLAEAGDEQAQDARYQRVAHL